jgi:hypothetical protein
VSDLKLYFPDFPVAVSPAIIIILKSSHWTPVLILSEQKLKADNKQIMLEQKTWATCTFPFAPIASHDLD